MYLKTTEYSLSYLVLFNGETKLPNTKPVHDDEGHLTDEQEHVEEAVSMEEGQHVAVHSRFRWSYSARIFE